MEITMLYVNGHVEVYDAAGRFIFSADSVQEAMQEMGGFAA